MKNILITSAGRRVELVNYFREEGRKLDTDLKVICVDLDPELSPACRIADLYFGAPRVTSKDYIGFLKETCTSNSISLILICNSPVPGGSHFASTGVLKKRKA